MKKFYVFFTGTSNGEWVHSKTMKEAKNLFMKHHELNSLAYVSASRNGPLTAKHINGPIDHHWS